MSEMAKIIFDLIEQKHTNATALCRKAGISRTALSELKAGRTKTLSIKTLSKIADALDVPVEVLMPDCFTATLTGLEEEPDGAERFKSDADMLDFLEKGIKKEPGLSTELSDDIIDVVDKIHSLSDEKQKLFLQLANPLLDSLMSDEK